MPQGGPIKQDVGDAQMDVGGGANMMPSQPPPTDLPPPGHMRSLSGGGGQQPRPMMPMGMNPGAMNTSPVMITQQMQKMIEQKERARQNPNPAQAKPPNVPVWQGVITWQGINPAGEPREVSCFVVASNANREAWFVLFSGVILFLG